jgi:hypothetical protein
VSLAAVSILKLVVRLVVGGSYGLFAMPLAQYLNLGQVKLLFKEWFNLLAVNWIPSANNPVGFYVLLHWLATSHP